MSDENDNIHPDPVIQDIHDHTGRGWYGCVVGEGWHSIVKDVHTQILAKFPDYEVWQIKEKFGGLRYYCSVDGDEDVQAVICKAEELSWQTCEDCGSTENVTTAGRPYWVRTLCENCGTPNVV
jgi:hypothetical protein